MTPAITLLLKEKIKHTVLKYEHDTNTASYGLEAAEKLELDVDKVFKTLVVCDDNKKLAVAIVPVSHKLSEKKMAKALGVKKVAMANADAVIASTGYVLGGVSPLGQKKRLASIIDKSAETLPTMHVSAGKRGLEVALAPADLALLTSAKFADISVS